MLETGHARPDPDVRRRRPLCLHPREPLDHRHRGESLALEQQLARERRAIQLAHREHAVRHAST
ncbi:MAG: hypothetical protein AUG91_09970 [Actinobacteria bacterium 13_1_20CM_4_69_9]|nr:MAG: hypothetical protein AUG91_09970 [Actinobacteria bacterium 13_1_20CM_4_69_9]